MTNRFNPFSPFFFLNTNVWGGKKKDLSLFFFFHFQFVLENIFITLPGRRKPFPIISSYKGIFKPVLKKKQLRIHSDKPLFDTSDDRSIKFVVSLLSVWFNIFKMNGIHIRRQQDNRFLPLVFLLHHQWNWLWIQQFWALWVFLCSSGQAGTLFLFSQLPGKHQHF